MNWPPPKGVDLLRNAVTAHCNVYMRVGTVTLIDDRLRPVTPIWVEGASRESDILFAEINTGFSGWFTLPSRDNKTLGLEYARNSRILLASGSTMIVEVYSATVTWWGPTMQVEVHQFETNPLIGMSFLDGNVLTIDARQGGAVEMEPATEPIA